MRTRPARRRQAMWAAAAALGPASGGCSSEPFWKLPTLPKLDAAPQAASPEAALRRLQWCYNSRSIAQYRDLFTDDYRFLFSVLDPYGNAYRENPWTREDEVLSTTKLFQGGAANQPAGTSISLTLDRDFRVSNDPYYPGSGKWRKSIRTSVMLIILDANQNQTNVTGFAHFFLVRGDSALIPQELKDEGFGPDSTRWYIRRWEDDTARFNTPPPEGAHAASPAAPGRSPAGARGSRRSPTPWA